VSHGAWAVHASHAPNRDSRAVGKVQATMSRGGPHERMLQGFHGLEDLESLPYVSCLLEQTTLVVAES